MGVTGLWRLIEPSGKPVPVETLENKVLAIDISIWLHQVVKGYQDAKGAPLPNAHLMGLFQRLCKLLYFKIKPVFVFDGAFPELKKETIAKRQDNKSRYHSESERLKRELALLLSKKTAISSLLGKQISPKKLKDNRQDDADDIFKLPALPDPVDESSESESDEDTSSSSIVDLHSIDLESDNFKKMPVKEKYDVLLELKETRKMNSWGRLHELPKKSDNFSNFQMERLLKRRKVQECLQETEKEMGSTGLSLNELESILNEEGIDTKIDNIPTRRIAANNNTRYLLINDVKQALADAKKQQDKAVASTSAKVENEDLQPKIEVKEASKKDELDEDLEKAIQMSLECVDEPNTSTATDRTIDDSWTSFVTDSDDNDSDPGGEVSNIMAAKAYIIQNTDYTHKAIETFITNESTKPKVKQANLDDILQELNKEKAIIMAKLDVSSEDEICSENVNIDNSVIEIGSDIKINSENIDSSLAIVENTQSDVITLGSSDDDLCEKEEINNLNNVNEYQIGTNVNNKLSDSDTSDGEFVEVIDTKVPKPVVELNLNLNETLEDDIFADVFQKPVLNIPEKQIIKEENEASEDISDNEDLDLQNCNLVTADKEISDRSEIVKITKNENQIVSNDTAPNKDINYIKVTDKITLVNNSDEKPSDTSKALNYESENEIKTPNKETVPNRSEDKEKLNIPPAEIIEKEKINEQQTAVKEKIDVTPKLINEIQQDEDVLLQEKGRLDRIGRNITEQMTKEAQELLQIFGVPYIVAPMEAEAQCAFLESVNLTDGTITDDSDIWLFGGKTVYKNFFNQKKHVLQFLSERIEKSFNLSREQLILLAMLVGSDYTTGVSGVGPVTALEILASFPYNKKSVNINIDNNQMKYSTMVDGLREFKKWLRSGRRTDDVTLKKKLKNVNVSEEFPSVRVVQAYLEPNVEKSEDKFSWGEIDLTILRDYTRAKFGWSQNKLDEIIKPVLKRLNERNAQKNIQDYFKRKIEFQSLDDQMSKRVKAAVHKMGPDGHIIPVDEPTKKPRKRKLKQDQKDLKIEVSNLDEASTEKKAEIAPKEIEKPCKPAPKRSKAKIPNVLKIVDEAQTAAPKTLVEIKVNKTDRFQEVIPQREKDKQGHLQNKMKAIEIFRKTKLDRKSKPKKKRVVQPKASADLSESD